MGFPLRGLLSSGPHFTTGVVSSLAGLRDDTRYLQVTVPVQPGNSGGPLLDAQGHVIGIIVAKLDALKTLGVTGDLPQNVNFAISGGLVRAFLDVNTVDYDTAETTTPRDFAEVAELARDFTIIVECWK